MKKLLFLFLSLPFVVDAQTPLYQQFNPLMPKPVDGRYGRWNGSAYVPFSTVSAANDSLTLAYRYKGMTVPIGNSTSFTEYWYMPTTANGDLVLKFSGGGGVGTVTNVAMTVPSGFSVSGSPITTSGTLAITAPGNATTQYINGAGGASLVSNLPISTATQTALDLKANLASPALTGTPTAPTAAAGTNTTQIATTAHVFAERSNAATLTAKTISGGSNTLTNINGGSLTDNTVPVAKMQASGSLTSTTYLRGDGTWSVPTGAGTTYDYDYFYLQASDIMLTQSTVDKLIITRATPASTTVTVTIPGLNYGSGKMGIGANFWAATGLTNQVMPSGSCIYVDLTDPLAVACIYSATSNALKDVDKRAIVLENMAGRIVSPIPGIQSMIDAAEAVYAATPLPFTEYVICPSGCDYPNITDALDDITDASATNRYVLFVKNSPVFYRENGPTNTGLGLKDYIDIVGESIDSVILKGPAQAIAGNEANVDCIKTVANCTVKNLTILGDSCKYPVHIDNSNFRGTFTMENVVMHHGPSNAGWIHDVGMGLYGGQTVNFRNCRFTDGGIYIHGNAAAARDTTKSFVMNVEGCWSTMLDVDDYIEYVPNVMNLYGNTIDTIHYKMNSTVYDANPSDRSANRGFKPQLQFKGYANKLGNVGLTTANNTNPIDSSLRLAQYAGGGAAGDYLEETPSSIQTGVVPRWNGKTTISSAANTGGQLEVGASVTTIHGGYDNNILARSTTPMIGMESLTGFPFAFGVSGASCYIKTIAGNAAITDASGNWVFLANVKGTTATFTAIPAYANDAAAAADGAFPSGGFYTITGSTALHVKP